MAAGARTCDQRPLRHQLAGPLQDPQALVHLGQRACGGGGQGGSAPQRLPPLPPGSGGCTSHLGRCHCSARLDTCDRNALALGSAAAAGSKQAVRPSGQLEMSSRQNYCCAFSHTFRQQRGSSFRVVRQVRVAGCTTTGAGRCEWTPQSAELALLFECSMHQATCCGSMASPAAGRAHRVRPYRPSVDHPQVACCNMRGSWQDRVAYI